MDVTVNIRLPESLQNNLKAASEAKRVSASKVIQAALRRYTEGDAVLTVTKDPLKSTTFRCNPKTVTAFKEAAKQANMPFDEALRLAVAAYLEAVQNPDTPHNAVHSTTPVKSDNI